MTDAEIDALIGQLIEHAQAAVRAVDEAPLGSGRWEMPAFFTDAAAALRQQRERIKRLEETLEHACGFIHGDDVEDEDACRAEVLTAIMEALRHD